MTQFKHKVKLPLRYTDMDAFRHVNNNIILSLYDEAKNVYFRDLFGNCFFDGRGIVVANFKADFYSPIFYPGEIIVCTRITHLGNKSMTIFQQMLDSETSEVKNECTTIMVAYDIAARKSVSLSSEEKQRITEYENL